MSVAMSAARFTPRQRVVLLVLLGAGFMLSTALLAARLPTLTPICPDSAP